MNSEVHIEIALMFGGVGAMCALEVHVPVLSFWPLGSFPLVRVLNVVLQVLLTAKGAFTVAALKIVFVHFRHHLAVKGQEFSPQAMMVQHACRGKGEHMGKTPRKAPAIHLGG